jgi:hypothetical protein
MVPKNNYFLQLDVFPKTMYEVLEVIIADIGFAQYLFRL